MNEKQKEFLEQALANLDRDILFLRTKRAQMATALGEGGLTPIALVRHVQYVEV